MTQPSQVCSDDAVPCSSRMVGVSSGAGPEVGLGGVGKTDAPEGVPGLAAVGLAGLVGLAALVAVDMPEYLLESRLVGVLGKIILQPLMKLLKISTRLGIHLGSLFRTPARKSLHF